LRLDMFHACQVFFHVNRAVVEGILRFVCG
jgi:hypothetical protein